MIQGLDHLQLSIPVGRLDEALAFYVDVMRFTRVPKPPELAADGGAWLRQGGIELHLGEEQPFSTDGRAHPSFTVSDMDAVLEPVIAKGLPHRFDQGPNGYKRASVFDPFGNRIELMQKL
ncbi:MAG: VOC family protein [Stagnimonas sp.]|nr:VOC family protein [Stagnimonas sp.]